MIRLGSVLLLVLLLPVPVAAQGRNMYLEEARQRLSRNQPEQALDELRRALDMPGLPDDQRLEILALLGASLYLSGKAGDAVVPWEERIRLAPEASFPEGLPLNVVTAFDAVRDATVVIEHLSPPGAFAGRPLALHANLIDRQSRARDILAYYRRRGESDWSVKVFEAEASRWVARLLPPPAAGDAERYALEYYLVVQASNGEVLHGIGSGADPLLVQVMAGPREFAQERIAAVDVTPVPRRAAARKRPGPSGSPTWLWVGLGVLAAGAAAAGGFMVLGQEAGPPATTLGVIHYPLGGEGDR